MAAIRPSALPPAGTVTNTVALIIDDAATVQRASPQQVVDAGRPIASQAQAEAGTDNATAMTPLRVRQSLSAAGTSAFIQAGAGAVPRPANDKMRESVSIEDFGAVGNGSASDKDALLAAATALPAQGGVVELTAAGPYNFDSMPAFAAHALVCMDGANFTGAGATGLGFQSGPIREEVHINTTALDFATRYLRRNANHVGGTSGYVNSGLRVDSYVQAGVTNFEWALTVVMDTSSPSGENVATYNLCRARGAGPGWGSVSEIVDYSVNPTSGRLGIEVDVSANGTDDNNARIGIDIAVRKNSTGGADCVASWGCRIQNGAYPGSSVKIGYGFQTGMTAFVGFDTSLATINQAAFKMAQGQVIAFTAAATTNLRYTGGAFAFRVANVDVAGIASTGAYIVGANQVVGGRSPGWVAPTGTATRATFATGSVTLPVLAEHVKALIDDLIGHGMIGA